MKLPQRKPLASAFGILLCSITCNTALAEGALEEVVVTAQKRTQNLQDVPVAVSAFSGEMLRESGVRDMFELSAIAPSLIVSQQQTSTSTTFGIRGVFTSSQNFGLESSVGLYVDGVYRARQGSMINNMVDVASVEVLRGPQGTLFGRNTPAGAVTVTSVKPDFESTGYLEAGAGKYDLLEVNGAKSLTLIDDVLALRATGFKTTRDGYVDVVGNEIREDDAINDRDRWGVRFQALYTPNDDLSLHFIGDHSEVDEICCAVGTWENNFYARNPPPPEKSGTDLIIRDQLGGTVLNEADFYDYKVSASFKPESQNEDKGVSLQSDWQTDYFLLTSISAYREHESYDNIDADFYDIDGLFRVNDLDQEQYSQEFRISNDLDKLNYVAGLYFYHQELDSTRNTVLGKDVGVITGADSIAPDGFPPGSTALDLGEQEHDSYAVFGQADYRVTEQFVVTAGLRWTYEDKDMTNTFTQDASPTPVPGSAPGWALWLFAPTAPRDDVDENFDDNKVTGTFKLSWFMNDFTMFYGSYGTGYKGGGINTDRIPASVSTIFDPETSEAFELGMKAEFPDQALRVNVALHKTDTDELQTISFQGTGFVLDNAGTAETYGGELDILWLPTDSTTITLAYAYNNAEYSDFQDGPCWTGTPWQTSQPDPNSNGNDPETCDRSGGMVSGNPENVVALTGNQQFRLTEDLGAFVHGEFIYTDERMTDVNNDPAKLDGSYNVVNLRAGILFERWDTTLTLWGRNIFDEDATNTIADAVAQDGRFIAYYMEPTTWGLSLRKDF
jgi:iron complex outermembrane receptor protein